MNKKKVAISGINLFNGGPVSIIKDCLYFLNKTDQFKDYQFIALVHKKSLFNCEELSNIKFVEFPKSRKSYLFRLYYEYVYFKKFAKQNQVKYWLSLHDMSPSLDNVKQAVYCHNATPFHKKSLKDILFQRAVFFFAFFYQYLYAINIHKNEYVIVQQLWIKKEFAKMFRLNENKIIVAPPQIAEPSFTIKTAGIHQKYSKKKVFFFPSLARPFKNIEVVCEAVKLLNNQLDLPDFIVILTIDGTENGYAKHIYNLYGSIKNIDFIGLQAREKVYELYSLTDCLVFPSKLETWGLPLSEFKMSERSILASDLPYAHETIGSYNKVRYFNPDNPKELASVMSDMIQNKPVKYSLSSAVHYPAPTAHNWSELFRIILA